MAKKERTYEQAVAELEGILEKIESGELNVDMLTAEVAKASELIKFCRQKLYATEKEVEEILEKFDEEEE